MAGKRPRDWDDAAASGQDFDVGTGTATSKASAAPAAAGFRKKATTLICDVCRKSPQDRARASCNIGIV
eukprot:16439536-Heterocapsa_arctica.AAC.1